MTRTELLLFLRAHSLGVVATRSPAGLPQAAVVGIATSERFEIIFDTLGESRKAHSLRHSPEVACVVGWDSQQTAQIEGNADEPSGEDLKRVQRCYFAQFPDGPMRLAWPGITYFRIRPRCVRFSDFRESEARIVTFSESDLEQ
jgi:pyridoxine/pyridoxamine 5'-phosphate oxidase